MAASPATQAFPVTISLLPVCLSLVHIPRTRLLQLVHPIVRQILLPSPAFLNLTCNEIELTIFAEHHLLADFEHVARKERQRHRSRSGSTSSRGTQPDLPVDVAVEVSYEKWHVLQIDSHSSGLNSAGARVHEISAPLAAAGISILYQSSYMSDFIFVKASRLKEAMAIFASAGFDVFASDDSILPCTPSGLVSTPFFDGAPSRSPSTSRRKRAPSMTSGGISPVPLESVIELPISELPSTTPQQSCLARSDSLLPSISDVRLLGPDLTCIGLCDESADVWSLKLIKLVAYPELIDAAHVSTPSTIYSLTTSFHMHGMASPVSMSDFSEDEEGYYSASQNERSSSPSSMSGRSFTRSHSLESSSDSRKSSRSARLHPMPSMAELSLLHSDSPPPSAAVHKRHPVPFFSFTRTAEGSSLTAPTTVLATLFPRSERHMIMRGNELDELEDERSPDSGDSDYERDERNTPMRCLQIDLRQFGLDKYGLVNRFSRILEEHGINHMYSSTFKTANLLVDRARASKAKALLRAC